MCPSFSGDYGAYQATAIALASDIFASFITSYIYAKNKNIDLKHGWLLAVCIITMSSIGSIVAYFAGNVVLGNFSLIITFFIGILFLVKPDSSKKEKLNKRKKLTKREIIISVFFGLAIGFGTGFFGSGGGMMMLIVFTVFLGYELKTAVGTSTFIMAFTTLVAFICHFIIYPDIVIEKWNVLLICVITTTFFSIISAKFANRVNSKKVGITTGVILTVLVAILLYLKLFY